MKHKVSPFLRMALEAGPLLIFFVVNSLFGIMTGTACLIVAAIVSLVVSYRLEKKLPFMPVIGCIGVVIFGGLTLFFHDDLFIKIKPTVLNLLFGLMLLISYALKKNALKLILGPFMPLKEQGWRILTLRWGLFFVLLAVLNEIVWRNFSTDIWVNFKVFGSVPLTLIFSAFQYPIIIKYQILEDKANPQN